MDLKQFLTKNDIPHRKIWYYLRDSDGRKMPEGEKNDDPIEKIMEDTNKNPKPKYIRKIGDEYQPLSETEIESYKNAYSAYIKFTDYYCIDVDVIEIKSMDDFISSTGCELFKNTCWTTGNNKGIHIYIKINDMIEYSNEIEVFDEFKGDLLHKQTVWERVDKTMNNSTIETFDYDDIKHLLNLNKMNIKNTQTTLNSSEPDVQTESKSSEIESYIKLAIKYEMFKNMKDNYTEWRNIGFIIKNDLGDNGEDLFIEVCKVFEPEKFIETDSRNFYKLINKNIKQSGKKPLTVASLVKMFKDIDPVLTKKIIKESKQVSKPNNDDMCFDDSIYNQTPSTDTFPMDKLDHFNSNYCNSLQKNYQTQKKYFEMFVCKVMRPTVQFIYIEGASDLKKDICFYNKTEITNTFQHIQSGIINMTGNKIPFMTVWLSDPNIRVYNNIEFNPTNSTEPTQDNKNYFNLFQGYNNLIHSEYNKQNTDKILKPFFDLGLQLCGGNQSHFEYFLKWLAHIVQKPHEKISIACIIKGKQGTGKNVFLNAFGSILGKKHFISSSNPNDFFGDYAEGFYHKLLVNMNECEGKSTFDYEGKIKSFISEDTITLNPKFVRPITINNFARVLIFTNKANPIPIDVKSGDRRYCVFQTTDHFLDKKYGTNFWTPLTNHFKRPEFIACLYNYFNTLDISTTNWRTERPITQAYKDMCKLYAPIEALFFEEFLIRYYNNEQYDSDENDIKGKELYDEYCKFCKTNGFTNESRYQNTIKQFYNKLNELEIPYSEVKKDGYMNFRIIPKNIYDHLNKRKWINRDKDDDIVVVDNEGEMFTFEV
jgi:hypothetical protein